MAQPIEVTAWYYSEVLVTCPICGNESAHRDEFERYVFDGCMCDKVPITCPHCKTEILTVKFKKL